MSGTGEPADTGNVESQGTAAEGSTPGSHATNVAPIQAGIGSTIPQPVGQLGGMALDPTNPVNSNVQVSVALDREGLDVPLWIGSVTQTCVCKNVSECLFQHLPGTKGDAVAMSVVLQKIPTDWAHEASEKGSAMLAFQWVKNKFTGGHDLNINDDWQDMIEKESMSLEGTMEQYVSRKKLLAARINGNGGNITEEKLRRCIINNLPWQFEVHKATLTASTATSTVDGMMPIFKSMARQINFDDKVARLPRANMARKGAGGQPHAGTPDQERQRTPRGACWFCHEEGHYKGDCPLLKERNRGSDAQRDTGGVSVGMVSTRRSSISPNGTCWIVDSGTTNHICNDIRIMSDVVYYKDSQPLGLAVTGNVAERKAKGKVVLEDAHGGTVTLRDVEFVPRATENLLSVSAAVSDGLRLQTNHGGEYVGLQSYSGNFACGIQKRERLYFLTGCFSKGKKHETRVFANRNIDHCELWHKRLGHPGEVNMQRLSKEEMVNGMKMQYRCAGEVCTHCDACIRGKQSRSSY